MKLTEVREGMKLRANGGFSCIQPGAELVVKVDADGYPFVPCSAGSHFLGGQVDDNGNLIGLEAIKE